MQTLTITQLGEEEKVIMSLPRTSSKTGVGYDFLFRRPSDLRACKFQVRSYSRLLFNILIISFLQESILAIAASRNEQQLKQAACKGLEACIKNLVSSCASTHCY